MGEIILIVIVALFGAAVFYSFGFQHGVKSQREITLIYKKAYRESLERWDKQDALDAEYLKEVDAP